MHSNSCQECNVWIRYHVIVFPKRFSVGMAGKRDNPEELQRDYGPGSCVRLARSASILKSTFLCRL